MSLRRPKQAPQNAVLSGVAAQSGDSDLLQKLEPEQQPFLAHQKVR